MQSQFDPLEAIVDAETVVQAINDHGVGPFTVLVPLPGGESGMPVLLLADADGPRCVLKCRPGAHGLVGWRRAMRATDALRRRGYPAPAHLLTGRAAQVSYLVQELLPSEPLRRFTADHLPELLRLNGMQAKMARQARLTGSQWPAPVIEPVLEGGNGFCLHEPLRRYSAKTKQLLGMVRALAVAGLEEPYRTTDIVHYDWSPGNVLAEAETITGVIDWEAVCAGDRCFDLVTALFYGYEDATLRRRLWAAVLELVSPRVAGVYLAHLLLRQVDWSIQHHSAADVAHWLSRARIVLADVCRRNRT